MLAFLSGVFMGFGLIIAICAGSDVILILAGVGSLGAVVERVPWLTDAVTWGGAVFLAVYGVLAARRALSGGPSALDVATADVATSVRSRPLPIALTALALTWLNPHVYLDTVFLLGSVAATHGDGRWWFALGASIASLTWFTALGLGARWLGRYLRTPRAWRVLDGAIAFIMFALAVSLVVT